MKNVVIFAVMIFATSSFAADDNRSVTDCWEDCQREYYLCIAVTPDTGSRLVCRDEFDQCADACEDNHCWWWSPWCSRVQDSDARSQQHELLRIEE